MRRLSHDATTLRLTIGEPVPKTVPFHKEIRFMAFQLHDNEQVAVDAEALNSEGNPAGPITWASSDDTIVAANDNGDGSALLVASPGAAGLGSATISATVTNSDGSTLVGTADVEVIPSDAVAVNIVFGTPEEKPAAAPEPEPEPAPEPEPTPEP